ncbi:MAG: hypothetical protein DWG83_00460 [Chloroflexi bacterium]|nr:hypothetical protein [Chloroflexota bacterium]MQC19031.1 hypothetical protein [Chloroflexota bacterium]
MSEALTWCSIQPSTGVIDMSFANAAATAVAPAPVIAEMSATIVATVTTQWACSASACRRASVAARN